MKADMSALKDQMASMMEAMLGMKRLIESNAATAATASTATEADPVLPNLAHQLGPDMVGRGRDTFWNTNSPRLGYT